MKKRHIAKRTINQGIGCNTKPREESRTVDPVTTDQICDICVQNVPGPEREKIFAFGRCNHSVCYVCSTRLRAICDQLDCPICREKLDCVIFCANKNTPFEKHDIKRYIYDERQKIYFENESIKEAFTNLLKLVCLECMDKSSPSGQTKSTTVAPMTFPDVQKLKSHLSVMHKLKLCDLCLSHKKLFPSEYSYYNNITLMEHIRNGGPKTPDEGHPSCALCHQIFFNNDELIQHMSREHFHCHLCATQNTSTCMYFPDYPSLREHFRTKHFLCERGNCKHEQFTRAYDNEIAFQLHVAEVHGGSNLTRGEARQQRTITLDSAPHRAPVGRQETRLPPNVVVISTGTPATANSADPGRRIPESMQQLIRQQRLPARSEFPELGQPVSRSNMVPTSQVVTVSVASGNNQFPCLAQINPNQQARLLNHRVTAGPSSSRQSFVRTAGGGSCAPERLDEMDFPPLPEQPNRKDSKTKVKKPMVGVEDDSVRLQQLINSSLTLTSRKGGKNKANKSTKSNKKPRAIKIQL